MNHNLDVYAIQGIKEELAFSVSKIKEGFNYIYSNLVCTFTIGNQKVTTKCFDTMLYNEESDILILLLKDGIVTKEDLIQELEKNGKEYGEITFDELDNEEVFEENLPEFWFAREQYVLEDGIDESLEKGISSCEFYPNVESTISFHYVTNHTNKEVPIDGRFFKGIVLLEDKWIFLVSQKDNTDVYGNSRNMDFDKVLKVLQEKDITCTVNESSEVPIIHENLIK